MHDPAGTIREQATKLLKARSDLTQKVFAARLGVTPSWVSHFLAGTRTAKQLDLIVRMARVFNVPVGYLLNEVQKDLSGDAAALLAVYREIQDEEDRNLVLQTALNLRERRGGSRDVGATDARNDAAGRGASSSPPRGARPRSRKRR